MLAPVTHIIPLTNIRRERILPLPGKILVRKGQKVGATDIIAETSLSSEHLMLDISRGLGVSPSRADHYVQCKVGDQIAEGDLIAGPVGLTRRVMRTPRNGRVIQVEGGRVLLEVLGKSMQLKAGFPGEVVDLIPDRGAIIETTGALVQGVWGNGMMDYGVMYVRANTADQILTNDLLDVSLRSSIVLAGHCEKVEALNLVAELPLRGLILSSLNPALIPLAEKLPMPIMILEGFGQRPINSIAFKLLSTNEKREVALNAERRNRFIGSRPEVIIPLPASGERNLPRDTEWFTPGQQVRILSAPFAGKIGTLEELSGMTIFPNGIRALGAEVRLENGEKSILPLANLEVVE
jgi:hypothetical protein